MRLAIIADDFTGALDVGVQFVPYHVRIKIAIGQMLEEQQFAEPDVDVLVVDAETRHQSPREGEQAIEKLVSMAERAGVEHLYIKTDSGLRGNIGATLAGALRASGMDFLAFAPAFPQMGRPTRNGVQYHMGFPIHESPFGKDPFEPVKSSVIADLFESQMVQLEQYPVANVYDTATQKPTIGIFDAETTEDLQAIGSHLKEKGQTKLLAGCAAFAAVLPQMLDLRGRRTENTLPPKPLLVLCGSLNPITRRQLETATAHGFVKLTLTQRQQISPDYLNTPEGKRWFEELLRDLDGKNHVILETADIDIGTFEWLKTSNYEDKQEISSAIASRLGEILLKLLQADVAQRYTPMVVGGDTLMGIMRHLDTPEITVESEVEPGVVMFSIVRSGEAVCMISKSGGFGDERLLVRMAAKTSHREVQK